MGKCRGFPGQRLIHLHGLPLGLEHRRGKLILSDQSTNGTFIRTSSGQIIFLRREEFILFGSGYISLGRKVDPADPNIVHFLCE